MRRRSRSTTAPLVVRIGADAIDQARAKANDLGMTLADYIETLITEQAAAAFDYHAHQAAFQSFVAATLSTAVCYRVLGDEEFRNAEKYALRTAATLFGRRPRRPASMGESPAEPDPRIDAILKAFAPR